MKAPTKVGAFSFVYPLLISFLTAEFVICQPAEGQRFEPVNFHHKDIPKGMSFFIFLKQSVKFFRRSCGVDAGGGDCAHGGHGPFSLREKARNFPPILRPWRRRRDRPQSGNGRFSPSEDGCLFCRLRRRGGSHAAACGRELLPGGSGGLQKGVQDTPKDVVSAVAH